MPSSIQPTLQHWVSDEFVPEGHLVSNAREPDREMGSSLIADASDLSSQKDQQTLQNPETDDYPDQVVHLIA
jgi:hypothetical protein